MSNRLIGKKLGMTSLFLPDGSYIPVTVVKVGPCFVTQIKTKENDGYNAVQLGFEENKASKTNKPMEGHFKKSGAKLFRHLREVRVDNPENFELGQEIDVSTFTPGDYVNVAGYSKGRGFSGVMKRHGFSGGRKTHGSKSHRIPGSIGCSAWPGKVIKGKRLPGHYGVERKTIKNLLVVDVRPEENIMMIKGPVPGYKTSLIEINKSKLIAG